MAVAPDRLTYDDPLRQRNGLDAAGLAPITIALAPPATPMVTERGDGGATVSFGGQQQTGPDVDVNGHNANVAEALPDQVLDQWAAELLEGINTDLQSRKDWETDYVKGLKVLGLKIEETQSHPFEGASAARHPMLLEAILRYQATAYGELLPAEGPAKTRVIGKSTQQLDDAAERVREAFNFFLTQTASEYYPDFDRMLFHKAAIGTTFKKVYTCPLLGRPVSAFLLPDDVIVNMNASSIETAQRVTNRIHMRTSDLRRLQLLQFFRKVSLQRPTELMSPIATALAEIEGRKTLWVSGRDDRHTLFETICEKDLPGFEHKIRGENSDLPLTWLVTTDLNSRRILRVQRFWREGDPMVRPKQMYVKYDYVPGPGFYSLGLIHIIGNPEVAATQMLRELIDAGQFRNFPAWLQDDVVEDEKGDNTIRVAPGEGRRIKTGGRPIREVVMELPFREPSAMLAQMLQMVVGAGERVGGTAELQIGEGRQDAPVGTTLALIEQAMKITSAVHKRAHRSQALEFRLLKDEFARNPQAVWGFETDDGWVGEATGEDFKLVNIIPASDPNMPSHVQRMVRADALGRLQQEYPAELNRKATLRRRMSIMGFGDIDDLINPDPPQAMPMDPASENIAVMQGMPLKVDIHQDHQSHIASHLPILMSPAAQAAPQMVPMLAAHVVEHFAMHYRQLVESMIGMPLPPPGQPLPPQVEQLLSREIASFTRDLHAEMAQMAVGPFGADEHMVKMMENQVKAAKIAADARNAEIDNRVQLAEARAALQKHYAEMEAAAQDRGLHRIDQRIKLRELASKETVAEINARAKEAQARTAAARAHGASRRPKK